uniref:Mitochondrial chaperone BCS1 n=1 Tax=Kwoniella dejecticola CBS 10117 TaxID=1296121 RepID=A0A1A6A770_9TREE|nr:uncharacterized protein I303_03620 [Kwoniella dejecticola CBS 10117]OBR85905.1 hypothetical protein I303_03620 [Kwoniella dejecticola CBS 10117]
MSAYFHALTHGGDLLALSPRFIYALLKNQDPASILPMAIRALIIGIVLTFARRLVRYISTKLGQKLFPTAYISCSDPSYQWIISWIAQDPYAQSQIHDFQLCTSESRHVKKRNKSALTTDAAGGPGKSVSAGVGNHNSTWGLKEVIGQVLPTYQHSIRIRHNGNYLWITRRANGFAGAGQVAHFRVRTIAFRPQILREFIVAARDAYFAKEERELLIFHAKRINPSWQVPVSRPARPWSSVILPGNLKENLLRDIEKFLSDKETRWYASRGIPHRRGYLFHGAPGSGKTTLVTAIASKLALDIYVINPAQGGMDDAKLAKLFRDCPAKSIILIEDMGRVSRIAVEEGQDRENYEDSPADAVGEVLGPQNDGNGEIEMQGRGGGGGAHDLAPSTVTMSGLLNAIDGVSSQEGCVLVATTNHPKRLDPALSRAGRFDIKLEFDYAIPSQARELFLHFYPLEDFQIQNTSGSESDLRINATSAAASMTMDNKEEKRNISENDQLSEVMTHQPMIYVKDQAELDQLADTFASTIFPSTEVRIGRTDDTEVKDDCQKISMASLQSYLLQYKENPIAACIPQNIEEWLKSEMEDGIKVESKRSRNTVHKQTQSKRIKSTRQSMGDDRLGTGKVAPETGSGEDRRADKAEGEGSS